MSPDTVFRIGIVLGVVGYGAALLLIFGEAIGEHLSRRES